MHVRFDGQGHDADRGRGDLALVQYIQLDLEAGLAWIFAFVCTQPRGDLVAG